MSRASTCMMRFSKPSSAALEKGRLFGSAQTCNARAHLAARVADDDIVLRDEGRDRHRRADVDGAEPRAPGFLAGPCLHRHRLAVQRVEQHTAIGEDRAAVHRVAAGDALRRGAGLRLVYPAHRRAGLRKVERVEDVGTGRQDEHRVADDDRYQFLAAIDAGGEGEGDLQAGHVLCIDLVQRAVAGIGGVPHRHGPLPVLGRGGAGGGDDAGRRWRGLRREWQYEARHKDGNGSGRRDAAHLALPNLPPCMGRALRGSLPKHRCRAAVPAGFRMTGQGSV